MTEETQNKLAERLAQLLAESPLDDATKEGIIEHLDEMTEGELFELHAMLKKEQEQVARIASQIQMSNLRQEEDWQKVTEDQKSVADALLKKYVRQAEDAKKLEDLKSGV